MQIRLRSYHSQEELNFRVIGYGGDCIRGKTIALKNSPECVESTVVYNKVSFVILNGIEFAAD